MNALLHGWTGWITSPASATLGRSLAQNGLALLLQTSLLLGAGLWVLHVLQKRKSGARGLLGRALLISVLAGVVLSGGLSLSGKARFPALWNLSLPGAPAMTASAQAASHPVPDSRVGTFPGNRGFTASRASNAGAERSASMPALKARPQTTGNEQLLRESSGQLETRAQTAQEFSGWGTCLWLAAGLWLGGTVALLIWLGACHGALLLLRRGAQPLQEPAALATLAEVCTALDVRVPLLLHHPGVSSPFLMGLLRPAILLPLHSVALDKEALRAVLLHEAAHLKRHDLWWNALGHIGCALLWPQPLLWVLCHRLEQINEEGCDEAVLQAGCERQQYARCLLDWAERMTAGRVERVAGAGVVTGRSSIARRVQLILDHSQPKSRLVSKRLRWAMLAGSGTAVIAMPLMVSTNAAPLKAPEQITGQENTATTKKRVLQHLSDTNDYRVYIGGVSKGVLQGVWIQQKHDGSPSQIYLARTVRRQAAGSTRWLLGDTVIYTFTGDNRLVSEARVQQIITDLPAVSDFLAQQLQATSEPVTAAMWQEMQRDFSVPTPELRTIREWARNRGHATLTGRVLDDNGKPVARATVNVVISPDAVGRIVKTEHFSVYSYLFALPKPTRNLIIQNAVTNRDGVYRVTGLAGGVDYSLGMPDYGRQVRLNRSIPVPPQVLVAIRQVTAREGVTTAAPALTVTNGGLVHVRIEDKATGMPLPDVTVVGSAKRRWASAATSYGVDTNASGESLFRLPDGLAGIAIGAQMTRGSLAFVANSTGVQYEISHNAEVSVDGAAPTPCNGATEVKVVRGQTREVLLRLQRYIAPTPKPIPTPTLAPPHMPPPPGKASIVGRVVDETGRPVSGIPVLAIIQQSARWTLIQGAGLGYSNGQTPDRRQKWNSINGVLSRSAISRADGSFRLDGLTTAPYNIIIGSQDAHLGVKTPSAWVARAVEGVWAKEGQVVRRANPIVLTRGGLIQVRVVDKATGLPLGGVLFGSNGPQMPASADNVMAAKSDSQGRFTFRVAPGTTSLYIAGPNHSPIEASMVYADTGKPDRSYRVDTNRGLFAGSEGVQFEVDSGKPQFGLSFGSKVNEQIELQVQRGQTRLLTLRLRRLVPGTSIPKTQPVKP